LNFSPHTHQIIILLSIPSQCSKKHLKTEDYLSAIDAEDDIGFANEIIQVVQVAITPDIARNQFQHCGFRVE